MTGNAIDLLAYCLMPNHFHLLIMLNRTLDFPNTMRSFSTSYVKSFNRFNNRTGHLFEGDYQAKAVTKENHPPNVIRYIHLNAVFAGLVANPEDWHYSDYAQWIDDGPHLSKPSLDLRQMLFGTGTDYRRFAREHATAKAEQKKIEMLLNLA